MAQAEERRPASGWARKRAAPVRDEQTLVADIVESLSHRRKLLRRLGAVASVAIIAVSATIFIRTLMHIDVARFRAAVAATDDGQIALAFVFTAISYLALTGYDGLALRHLRLKIPYRLTATASFTSYAASFTLGFPLIIATAIRYWVYAPAGLTAGNIASLTVVAGITFWLGLGLIVGGGLLLSPVAVSEINHFHPFANVLIGLTILSALAAYIGWIAYMNRRGGAVIANFRLPGVATTLGQTALGVIDVCGASAALYVLLPKAATIGFPTFATVYSFGAMLGIASNSPGGLGVFEAAILQAVGGDYDALLVSLLLFRAIYYLVPFLSAMALLGGLEVVRRWRSIRQAITASSQD
jgi:uncharacterized membrane protein YbhN (UPF0104 family)